MTDYDAIVIGAGNAGLTAAATLQRSGLRTLLLERHNVPGGAGTSFRRGRFEFEVALHQLSGVAAEGQHRSVALRELFRRVGALDRLELVQQSDLCRVVVPGVYDVRLPPDWQGATKALEAAFPGNRERIERFFGLVKGVAMWNMVASRGLLALDKLGPTLFENALRPLRDVLDDHFQDEGIKSVLGSYWVYLGMPPSRLPFQEMAMMLYGYLELKPWHVRGGSQAMSAAVLESFRAAGGEVRFNTRVDRIRTEHGVVRAVVLADGTEVTAPQVVSNASAPITYRMLADEDVPASVSAELGLRRVGVSAVVIHLGLAATPAELGITSGTTLVNIGTDDDYLYEGTRSLSPARGVCVSCFDVDPIGFAPDGASHVAIVTLQYGAAWERLAPRDYAAAKYAYADSMLRLAEQAAPGIRDAIEEAEVASPLTVMRYLGTPGGAIYGYEKDTTDVWQLRGLDRESQVPGLHLAGAWSGNGGFQYTLEAGERVALRLLSTL
ncbi:phytoene desaturase family protein [Nocardia brasiliensis]|uniref:phytoene desaturase family protein n=1 Tax=Nocardia brasiliensis TaxID=37326 RepID=UPI0037B96A3A